MNNWKIIVYTIMKNEKHNLKEGLENIKDADGIYLLDTGSTDGSYEYALEMKQFYPQLEVKQKIYDNFQFDIARNDNLDMVPNENNIICGTIDLDERFISNWYSKTYQAAEQYPLFYKMEYWYACRHNEFGDVLDKHVYDKCHRRLGAKGSRPIHEILTYGEYEYTYSQGLISLGEEIFVHHYQDEHERRSSQYINLLKQRIKEDKYDIEAFHHLTTEYGKLNDLQSQIDLMLLQYGRGLMCDCSGMECICGNLAETFFELNNFDQAKFGFNNAISYNPQLKTYYIKYLKFLLDIDCLEEAEKFYNKKYLTANFYQQEEGKEINDDFCNLVLSKLFDMLALKYYYSNEYDSAYYFGQKAVEKLPIDKRLTQNLYYYEQKLSIKNAYVTVLSDNSFINGVIALDRSLKEVESVYPLYCIVTKEVSAENIAVLTALGIEIIEKNPDYYSDNHKEMIDVIETLDTYGGHKAMVKLELFNLTEFNKIVYLDSDMIVTSNIDHLFIKPHMSAARDCCDTTGYFGDGQTFNSGLMVIKPNKDEYCRLLEHLKTFNSKDQLIHDQLILQTFFKNGPIEEQLLSPEYNYGTTYIGPTQNLFIVHFIDKKPGRVGKQYFYEMKENYPQYADGNLWYIDYINETIKNLKNQNIFSIDLKEIQ